MRRFNLVREFDASGVSGIGVVAEGCVSSSGRVHLWWLTAMRSTGDYDSIDDLIAIHGHGGWSRIEWIDEPLVTRVTARRRSGEPPMSGRPSR